MTPSTPRATPSPPTSPGISLGRIETSLSQEPAVVLDPALAQQLRAGRDATDASRYDEVWEGIYLVSPLADHDHQWLVMAMGAVLLGVIDVARGDRVFPGINVSDRVEDWRENYRIPDIAVVLAGNPNRAFDKVMVGGPDLVVEILSEGDPAREKLAFYAAIGVREAILLSVAERTKPSDR